METVLNPVKVNVVLIALVLALAFALGAAAPSTAPSTRPLDPVSQWLKQLADDDPDVRDAAREQLMSLDRTGLRELKRAVERNRPLAPAQALALRDIVTHVYLASEPYAEDLRGGGFMGVRMGLQSAGDGITVVARIPGFAAYRSLRDGDVIVAVKEWPERLDKPERLGDAVAGYRGGETIHLKVQRGGRLITVPLRLSPRPANATNADTMRTEQMPAADEYWQQNFAPLLEQTASS